MVPYVVRCIGVQYAHLNRHVYVWVLLWVQANRFVSYYAIVMFLGLKLLAQFCS